MTTPAEVVTRALVRYVSVPGLPGEVALVTLDNGLDHTRPSTFGLAGLSSLDNAMDEIEARTPKVRAIAVTGKPFIFAVGADLSGVPLITTREQAVEIGRLGHRVFRRFKDSAMPTFAFVNGAAMGGGLELALHCHFRTLSAGAAALALPECFLGLLPGWGGTQLLPNLIGADKAVTVIVENALNQNRMLKAKQALAYGIADVMFEPADFLEESLRWLGAVVDGSVVVPPPEVERGDAWAAALARGKAIADVKTAGHAPAPYRALEMLALAETADFAVGTEAEEQGLADLLMSEQLRAGLYSFDLVQKRAKRPAGAPDSSVARPVTKVGIVGAGLMASQLALLIVARLEVPVALTDVDQAHLDKGVGYVHTEIDTLLQKHRVSPDKANRLKALVSGSLTKDGFADCDFVIEAVFEELAVKQAVFAEVEDVVSADCVLATNTSSLSVTEMASRLRHPERVVGFHFFNPVAILPLLEVVRGQATDDSTLATAFAVGKALRKSCVLVQDSPAFVFNRLVTRALGEVIGAVDDGTPFDVADRAVGELGLPLSPFVLLQLVGPAVAMHTAASLRAAFPDRFGESAGLRALVAAGKAGIYTWGADGLPSVDPEVAALWPQGDTPLTEKEVLDRARSALAEEIRILLDDGVVAAPQDVDLCLLLGGGWGFWNGGITPYLDRTGVAEKVNGRRFLDPGVASLPG
ncbi:MAG: enoyl-CoA hydratase/isomerase family protein [Geodermatophilaceae bacterium]|nr:enoyl-CoA hydratase/isomerase family protein [Geodermatophilaceae bacterium]